MLNFESLPKDKPSQSNVEEGRYNAEIFDAKMQVSKTTNNEYLNVSFKVEGGGFVNENYFDSDKPFLLYKLGRLLKACGVELSGEGSLRDVAKVVKGKKVTIDVAVNDRGYGSLDYSGGNEGIYPYGTVADATHETNEVTVDADIAAALDETNIADEDF